VLECDLSTIFGAKAKNKWMFPSDSPIHLHITVLSFEGNANQNLKDFDAQDYWVSGFFPSSGILSTRKHNVSETGSLSVLR
jgi:hypothetical protein